MIFQKKLSFITKPKEIQNKSTIADIPTQQSHIKTILPTCKLLSVRTTLKRLLISIQQKQSRIPPPLSSKYMKAFCQQTKQNQQPKASSSPSYRSSNRRASVDKNCLTNRD
ncbi:hypothetical protein CDAR_391661 [Caerostris darwini]|uniref:Uncharacterized protein n=1 Tax=Caerostris darwini TaxID=1538125 RepID=A0AAV4R1A5_9ARAC|nr:hypothetical protein CDAR_391661 [Caerostris darwini]